MIKTNNLSTELVLLNQGGVHISAGAGAVLGVPLSGRVELAGNSGA